MRSVSTKAAVYGVGFPLPCTRVGPSVEAMLQARTYATRANTLGVENNTTKARSLRRRIKDKETVWLATMLTYATCSVVDFGRSNMYNAEWMEETNYAYKLGCRRKYYIARALWFTYQYRKGLTAWSIEVQYFHHSAHVSARGSGYG